MKELVDIKAYAPKYFREYREADFVYEKENAELKRIWDILEQTLDNFYIETMGIDGIKRMESIARIQPLDTDTLEERRFRILSKLNKQLPYTFESLNQWLITNLGKDNFELNLYNEKYQLDLIIKEYSNKIMRYILNEIREMIPANILFIPTGSYLEEFEQKVLYDANLEILSSFYPRYNLEPRILNGSWLLNGKCLLTGYKADTILDFYPVSLKLDSDVNNEVIIDNQLQLDSLAEENVTTGSELEMLSDTEQEVRAENRLELDSETEQGVEYESQLIIEKDLWQLNGKVQLNGGRLLDAKITTFTL